MDELRRALDDFSVAWNRHDADELAALWMDDGVLNHPWGYRAVGRNAVRALLASEHASNMASSELRLLGIAVDQVRQNVAVVDVDGLLKDVRAPHGRLYDLNHRLSAVWTRTDAREWRIQTMTAFPTPVRA